MHSTSLITQIYDMYTNDYISTLFDNTSAMLDLHEGDDAASKAYKNAAYQSGKLSEELFELDEVSRKKKSAAWGKVIDRKSVV